VGHEPLPRETETQLGEQSKRRKPGDPAERPYERGSGRARRFRQHFEIQSREGARSIASTACDVEG
jgi:hypothetical protein